MIDQRTKHVVEEPVASTIISHRFSHATWGAIFAGSAIAIATQVLLILLGGCIGWITINQPEGESFKALGVGALLWWTISAIIAFYAGGWVSARMSEIPRRLDGMIHGLVTWSVTTIITLLFLTTSVGMLIAGGYGALKSAGVAVISIVPNITETFRSTEQFNNIESEANRLFSQASPTGDNSRVLDQLMNTIVLLAVATDASITKQQIVDILLQNTNLAENEARNTVDRWLQNIRLLRENAHTLAEDASRDLGKAALACFLMLGLCAIAAGIGGSRGAPHWSEQEIV